MRLHQVTIEHFRGIRSAVVTFPSDALLLGPNGVGKSTVLEALDLALGPDRARGPDAINEHDFHLGKYTPDAPATDDAEAEQRRPTITINVVLSELDAAEMSEFREHLEPWSFESDRLFTAEELTKHQPSAEEYVLRLGFRGWFDKDDDEFKAASIFLSPPADTIEDAPMVSRSAKRSVGFLYLRSLRTARRAMSLQRGSLLDVLLRLAEARPKVWEAILSRLGAVGDALSTDPDLKPVLSDLESRIGALVPLAEGETTTGFNVSRLTRDHLREFVTYFAASRASKHLLPYDRLGTGVTNVLVLALLSAIADLKSNVIFAMEEPEIALGPHTQRRVVDKVKSIATQAILTSHSPYVAEQFLPDSFLVLRRAGDGSLTAGNALAADLPVKEKLLRQEFRGRYAEGLVGSAVLVVEGVTEFWAIPAASQVLSNCPDTRYRSLDHDGVIVVPAAGDGDLAKTAGFYSSLGIPAFVFSDTIPDDTVREAIDRATTAFWEHGHSGFESLVASEVPVPRIQAFLAEARTWRDFPSGVPEVAEGAADAEWRAALSDVLSKRKGSGYAARLLAYCTPGDLPGPVIRLFAELRIRSGSPKLKHDDPLAGRFRDEVPAAVEEPPVGEEPENGGT